MKENYDRPQKEAKQDNQIASNVSELPEGDLNKVTGGLLHGDFSTMVTNVVSKPQIGKI